MAPITHQEEEPWFTSLGQDALDPWGQRPPRCALPMVAEPAHPTQAFPNNQYQPTKNRLRGHPSLSAMDPTVPQILLINGLGSHSNRTQRVREITYFVGLFQHLHNLKLLYVQTDRREEPVGDLTLIPPFIPPLQGSLMMKRSTGVGLLKDTMQLFGGLRFRHMDLFQVDGTRLLLGACAQTLESVVLDPTDPRSE